MSLIEFTVRGIPVPQGSARAFSVGGKARLVTKTAPLTAWRTAIEVAASREMGTRPLLDGPLNAEIHFTFPRPPSVKREYPAVKPDIDKLLRATFDALTGVVWRDDSRVVCVLARKDYGDVPGVAVWVWEEDAA